jgi:hypothetical protein
MQTTVLLAETEGFLVVLGIFAFGVATTAIAFYLGNREEKQQRARRAQIEGLACTWQSPLIDNVKDVLLAYFTGSPTKPYSVKTLQPFSAAFERGSSWSGVLSGCQLIDLKTSLLVTFRPNARFELEWSFKYDVPSVIRASDAEVAQFRDALAEELAGFRQYFLEFCGPLLDRPGA